MPLQARALGLSDAAIEYFYAAFLMQTNVVKYVTMPSIAEYKRQSEGARVENVNIQAILDQMQMMMMVSAGVYFTLFI